ncbi:hypothetical protein, partial [Methanosarcina sp. 2.H.T.1A.3]|uniref:hypothetical protein n=1 Tax=Methanosarcina sp. 2.H.T.1A.3 TaxID=1483597 RepID=UPI00064F1866
MPLYDYDKHLASAEQRVTEGDYSERSKALVFRFEKSLFAQGLSKPRVIKYLRQLNAISQWAYNEGFELEDATRDDIETV